MAVHVDLPVEISLLRIVAQNLVSCEANTPVEVVRHMLAMQGQQVSALPRAILARCGKASKKDVVQAFNSLALVRHRPMRGTVHVTTAQDYHWMRLTLRKSDSFISRLETELKIDNEFGLKAAEVAWQTIEQAGGAIQRKELFAAWMRNLEVPAEEKKHRRWCECLMWRMDRLGYVIEAPLGKNEHYFIDARRLPAADSPHSGFPVTSERDYPAARVEIARRYAYSHGPVKAEDLARWASISLTSARECLERAANEEKIGRFSLLDGQLVPASAPSSPALIKTFYYMRQELPELLEKYRKEAKKTIYLPSFDELHVGYKDRSCLTDESGEKLICPAKNGMFRPILISQGRLVAVNPSQGIIWVKQPSARLEAEVNRRINEMDKRFHD